MDMDLVGQTRILCVLFWACFPLAAAETTSPTTPPTTTSNNTDLWPDYVSFARRNQYVNDVYLNRIPLTYFETITEVICISINGYLSFGQEVSGPVPAPSKWPFSTKVLAAYWTTMDNTWSKPDLYTYEEYSRLDNVSNDNSLIQYVKTVVAEPEFEPLTILAVTWVDVRPRPKDDFPNDTATFQLLIATDSRVTYAIRSYQSVWQSPKLTIYTYYAGTYSQGRGQRPKITTPGSYKGPEVILLGTQKPNKQPYNCVQKAIASRTSLNASIYALPPCPCHMTQAGRDPQFKISNVSPSCYQSIDPPPGESLLQLCCYNQFGILLNYTKDARVPLPTNPNESSLQDAYETCCAEGSGLCRWFFTRLYRPDCVNNLTLLNTTEVLRIKTANRQIVLKAEVSTKSPPYVEQIGPNHSPVTYNITGDFNSSHGLSRTNSGFNWTVGNGFSLLRNLAYPRQLVVYLTDNDGISAADVPLVFLCLCEQSSQCNDQSFPFFPRSYHPGREPQGFTGPDTYERGNVNMMMCDCKGKATGRYCEKPINPCYNCLIQDKSVCGSNPQDYCPPCPLGYHRDGTQCRVGDKNNNSKSVHAISTAQVCVVIVLAFLSSALPWLQNSPPTTFTPAI